MTETLVTDNGEKAVKVNEINQYLGDGGNPLQKLVLNEADMSDLRENSIFQEDEYKAIDDEIVRVASETLNGIQDLRDQGLANDLGGLGALVSKYAKISDMEEAEVNMSGVTTTEENATDFDRAKFPVPIISKAFSIDVRELKASRRMGTPIDTEMIDIATELVSGRLEKILFQGDLQFRGNTIKGYVNFGDANTPSGTSGDWGGTPTNMYDDVLAMIEANENANSFGPYLMYVSRTQMTELRNIDVEDTGAYGTTRDRLLDLDEIDAIKVTKHLNDGEVVLVDPKSKYVQLDVGQDITALDWSSGDGMLSSHKIIFAGVPKLKTDYNGNSGICVFTNA